MIIPARMAGLPGNGREEGMGKSMEKNRIFLYSSPVSSRYASHECLGKAVAHYIASGAYTTEEAGRPSFPAVPPSDWRLERGVHGKPCFPEAPMIHFSISHSGGFWVCAISGQTVGVDIQERRWKGKQREEKGAGQSGEKSVRPGFICCEDRIAERFFHPEERQFLARRAREGSLQDGKGDFFDVWSAKESYVKYTGEGIGKDFRSFAVSDRETLLSYINEPSGRRIMLRHLACDPSYSLCVCAEKIGEVRRICL